MDLDNFKAPFIRPEQAWQEADRIRKEHWPSGQVPRITSVDDWIRFVESIPEDQYGYIEQPAYEFAGRLPVPIDRLRQEISRAMTKAKGAGFADWDRSGDAAREYMASNVCRVFGVSSQVIEKRIIRERLSPME